MKKIFFWLFLFFSILIKPVSAGNDIDILCSSNNCQKSSNLPLFSENNISPGFTVQNNLNVDNSQNEDCNLAFSAQNKDKVVSLLSERIDVFINRGQDLWYKGSLFDLLIGGSYRSLGKVDKNSNGSYIWSASFDKQAGNEFQDTSTNFDLNINFSCDGETSSNPIESGDDSPTPCTKPAPIAPTGLYAVINSTGSVTLHWTQSTSEHTHYLVAYGINPGEYLYGNPNVGNDDHYTVRSLTPGAQYCFYIRTINDCMPGDRSQETCVNSGSTIIPNITPPTDFQPEVLGVDTEGSDESNGEVLGTDEEDFTSRWIPLLFIFAFLFNLLIIKKISKRYVIITLLISVLAYIVDRQFLKSNYCLGPIWWCKYFWIGNFLSWILPLLIKRLKLTK